MLSQYNALLAATVLLTTLHPVFAEKTGETQPSEEKTEDAWQSEKRQAALKVQLFLDKKGFGPGKIDARWGGFTEKAVTRWNEASEASEEVEIGILEDGGLDLASVGKLPFSDELTTTYRITEDDGKLLGTVPDDPKEQAALESLPYTSLLEVVSEKFHADPDLILEINGLEAGAELQTGSEITVPNVSEPFDISEPEALAGTTKEQENAEDGDKSKPSADDGEKEPLELFILRDRKIVEVRRGERIVHSFPITPGANDNRSPEGNWKVSVISWMPEFRWDKSMLESGERSEDAYFLPPGPNNPVGIVWIGLNADGIGLHGTPHPNSIGRSRSHGCIRLSNWDALRLGKSVSTGTPVIVK